MGNGRVLAVLPMQYSPLRSEIQLAMVANTMCVLNKLNEGAFAPLGFDTEALAGASPLLWPAVAC